jgi:hypothetical protein
MVNFRLPRGGAAGGGSRFQIERSRRYAQALKRFFCHFRE